MSIESLIHEILQLNDKTDADIGLSSRLEESGSKQSEIIDERISSEFEMLDSLKSLLADAIVMAYTGKNVSEKKEG